MKPLTYLTTAVLVIMVGSLGAGVYAYYGIKNNANLCFEEELRGIREIKNRANLSAKLKTLLDDAVECAKKRNNLVEKAFFHRDLAKNSIISARFFEERAKLDSTPRIEKIITIKGKILSNQFDSVVDDSDKGILFWNESEEGRAILAVCKHEEICEVTGTVDEREKLKEFLSVSKVMKINASNK